MSKTASPSQEIIYKLEDKPPFQQSALAALQHLMAMFISIGAPPTIITMALGMDMKIVVYVASTAFFVSGIGTFIQTSRFGPLGSGLLSIQATSFIFLAAFISLGFGAKAKYPDISDERIIAYMSGATVVGSAVQMGLSRMPGLLRKVFTPLVCGVTVVMVGVSLIKVGITNLVGGSGASRVVEASRIADKETLMATLPQNVLDKLGGDSLHSLIVRTDNFASNEGLLLGFLVLLVILLFNCFKNPSLRMAAMVIGFVFGTIFAVIFTPDLVGKIPDSLKIFSPPVPFKYGFAFDPTLSFLSVALIYVVSTVEATGDLSATSLLSDRPTEGPEFISRLQGGILCDGFASAIAGCFNSFPMAIFAQNNGVIQLTGVASRHVGKYIAVYLFILGLFPIVGALFTIIPIQILGGALLLLFGIIAATGMRIIFSEPVTRRSILIIGMSLGVGLAAAFEPSFSINLPAIAQDVLKSPVAVTAFVAVICNLAMPNYGDE